MSELVLFGSNLDAESLASGLRGCVVSPSTLERKRNELRFAVGDSVQCRTRDGWVDATVVDLLYRDDSMAPGLVAPYQLRLEESNTLIFAPEDSHDLVRAENLARLRFAVADDVECNLGGMWATGTVVELMYREPGMPQGVVAPYQVKLCDGTLIYAPSDANEVIRRPRNGFLGRLAGALTG